MKKKVICLPTKHLGTRKLVKTCSYAPDLIGIWTCRLLRRGENRSTRTKTSRSKDENHQQTQPTYDTGTRSRTRATLVEGECSHHCTSPAPRKNILNWFGHNVFTMWDDILRRFMLLGGLPRRIKRFFFFFFCARTK